MSHHSSILSQYNNGRVNLKAPPNTSALFQMYDKIPANQCVTLRNPTEGLWNETPLSSAFFSRENIQIIQNGIRAGVFRRSKEQYVIGEQDCDELSQVMRSVFLQHAVNQPTHLTEQIEQLNQMVMDYCIQQIYSEAQGYMKYMDDVSSLVVPLSHPVQASGKDRVIESKPWF
jgi:hypothetical protein